jgi:phospholipase C
MGKIEHVFVLMLENRSFDHMLGFSGITGTDAATGQPTAIQGLTGTEFNTLDGGSYPVSPQSDRVIPGDPGHEFRDVLLQLCGAGATYPRGGPYPAINSSGFVASYKASRGSSDPGEIMKCFTPRQLPVLNALASEFVVCDNWYASLPGPTWPNRMFVHAASSGGLDHSPGVQEIALWESLDGFAFRNGTIFDALNRKGVTRRLYGGDDFPTVAALKGIRLDDIRDYDLFAQDLARADYPYSYVFIEPRYNVITDYKGGTSQHPLDDVAPGEGLIKATYEAIRNSAFWESSLLMITWDEHGGFYDHAAPPAVAAPGDTDTAAPHNQYGFAFDQCGPRVPAIVASPLIPRNLIDHRPYEHSSIPATLESLFGLDALTRRDAAANRLDALLSLSTARQDAPVTLPAPADSSKPARRPAAAMEAVTAARPAETVDEGSLPVVLHSALRQDLETSPPARRQAILTRVGEIKTRAEAFEYLNEVRQRVHANRARSRSL